MSKTHICGCGCGGSRCAVCERFDCKWPGECLGKCRECGGGPVRELVVKEPDGTTMTVSAGISLCSEACWRVDHDRAIANGEWVAVADLTPEQLNEMFQRDGLQLAGVGERKPS